jgi:hypothetical protein
MNPPTFREQRNPYRGPASRPWILLRLRAIDESEQELNCMVDTGSPFALIVDLSTLDRSILGERESVPTNYGNLRGGWVRCIIPDVRFDALITAYGSNQVLDSARMSSPGFNGVVGLPLLRQFEYGGNRDSFWIRYPSPAG